MKGGFDANFDSQTENFLSQKGQNTKIETNSIETETPYFMTKASTLTEIIQYLEKPIFIFEKSKI